MIGQRGLGTQLQGPMAALPAPPSGPPTSSVLVGPMITDLEL